MSRPLHDRYPYYLLRLRESPPDFLVRKLGLHLRALTLRPFYCGQRKRGGAKPLADQRVANIRSFGLRLRRGLQSSRTNCELDAAEALQRARQVIDDRFPCLGFGDGRIPRGVHWNRDQFHDFQWDPTVYFTRCDFLVASHRCDAKIPWEYSRLQFLLWLADASVLEPTSSPELAEQFRVVSQDWITSNPVGFGVNWTCGMEVAIRSVNLGLALAVFSEELPLGHLRSIGGVLREHSSFLHRFPEVSDVPGNHLLACLMGSAFLAALLEGIRSQSHRAATRFFFEEAERQFDENGCHIEHAPLYQALCLEMVALVTALASGEERLHGHRLLRAGVEFCRAIAGPSGDLPIFGDADGGHVIWFGNGHPDLHRLEASEALLTGGRQIGSPDDFTRWLGAFAIRSGFAETDPILPPTPSASSASVNGPFASVKNGRSAAIMRWGSHGLKGRAPHDHDDALSIWLYHEGISIIAEPGCHSYTLDPQIRLADLLSSNHNVLWRDGEDRYAPVIGSIGLTVRGAPTASRPIVSSLGSHCCMRAELHGTGGNWTARAVMLRGDGSFIVTDEWRWAEPVAGWLRWHLGPEINPKVVDENRVLLVDEVVGEIGLLEFESQARLALTLDHYRYSKLYGSTAEAWFVEVHLSAQRSGLLASRFRFHKHQPSRP